MARKLPPAAKSAIAFALKAGQLTNAQVAEKHGVSLRTVSNVKAGLKVEPKADPLVQRLDNLLTSAEEALEIARASENNRDLTDAIRAFNTTLTVVEKLRADLARQDQGGTAGLVEVFKRVMLEELHGHPEVRARVAERLLAASKAGKA